MAIIYNVPKKVESFVVARPDREGDYWYWGSWKGCNEACKAASEIGGEVFTQDEFTVGSVNTGW